METTIKEIPYKLVQSPYDADGEWKNSKVCEEIPYKSVCMNEKMFNYCVKAPQREKIIRAKCNPPSDDFHWSEFGNGILLGAIATAITIAISK